MGGVLLGSQALAFQLEGPDWAYMPNPMGENWVICPDRLPGEAVQRTKDGAAAWDYDHFRFTFASEACLSNGGFPILNRVNQVDFGLLPLGVLARTVFFFDGDQIAECDMRFNSAVNWYTETGTPAADQFDWWSVAAHEMGHCLGLDHEDNVTPLPVMQSELPVGSVLRALTENDIAGRNTIYSQPRGNPGGAPVASSSTGGGGEGGCSLMPGSPTAPSALFATLGNLALPLVVMVGLQVWSRRRAFARGGKQAGARPTASAAGPLSVHADRWYTAPPMKRGTLYARSTVDGSAVPPERVPRCDQPDPGRVCAARSTF